jgi:hypothetical protein
MSLPKEQLQMIEPNLPGVQILNADIVNEREVTIQVETAGDRAVCHNCGQKAIGFCGHGARLRPRHFQVFNRRSYLCMRPKRFGRPHCCDRPTTTHLDDWYDTQSGMTRAFAESLLPEIVGPLNDAPLKHQVSYYLQRGVLERNVAGEVEGLNDKAPAVIGGVGVTEVSQGCKRPTISLRAISWRNK